MMKQQGKMKGGIPLVIPRRHQRGRRNDVIQVFFFFTFYLLPFTFPLSSAWAVTSVKVYGAVAQADLSSLTRVSPGFQYQFCSVTNPTSCLPANTGTFTWSNIQDDGNGNVKNPGDGTMDAQGWMYADRFVQITNVQDNDPGWVLDIYTDNTHKDTALDVPPPVLYQGPFDQGVPVGSVNGLVSQDGAYLIPLAWKLAIPPYTVSTTVPMPQEDPNPTGGSCPVNATYNPSGVPRTAAGFCDFATHYMADKADTYPNQPGYGNPTWWEYVTDSGTRFTNQNFQSLLTSDGAATGDFYRSPYSTLTPGVYNLYISAKFEPGIIKETYQTIIFVDMVSQ